MKTASSGDKPPVRSHATAPLRFIRFRPEYEEAMLALHRSALEGFVLGMSREEDEADLRAIQDVYLRSGGEFLLGFVGEKLVAMGGFKRLSSNAAELRRMRIERQLQGLGCGTQLLRELERMAYRRGVRTMSLAAAEARPLTLKFYRKHGYRVTGHSFYGDVPTVQFVKALHRATSG